MKKNTIVAILCLANSLPLFSQEKLNFKTDREKLSYSLGINIAQNLKQQNMADDLDLQIFDQALRDELLGKELVFPMDSMNAFMQRYFMKKSEELDKKRKEQGEKNKTEGIAFLEKNKKKKGIISTPSGLQYEILVKSKSKQQPKPEDMVKVKYIGKQLDGTIFDSTDKNNDGNPIEFQLNKVIKGWTEGVSLMSKGAKYRFFIPSELAYGENGAGNVIEPNSVLIFDIELVDFTQNTVHEINSAQGVGNTFSGSEN